MVIGVIACVKILKFKFISYYYENILTVIVNNIEIIVIEFYKRIAMVLITVITSVRTLCRGVHVHGVP